MFTDKPAAHERVRAALPALAIHVLGALLLLQGLAPGMLPAEADPLRLFRVAPPADPPEPLPPPPAGASGRATPLDQADPLPEGGAAPPNLKTGPSPVVAPKPEFRAPIEPPKTVTAAPAPGTGAAASAGAAAVPGPGTGSIGIGTGTGSGRGGGGPGGGGGGGGAGSGGGGTGPGRVAVMPRHVRGDFSYRDIPDALRDTGFRGRVALSFWIDVDGRARRCRAVRSSGSRLMDAAACRALEQRFRFLPGRDQYGRPIAVRGELHPYFEAEVPLELDEPPPGRRRGW